MQERTKEQVLAKLEHYHAELDKWPTKARRIRINVELDRLANLLKKLDS